MKRIFMMFALLAVAFASCEPNDASKDNNSTGGSDTPKTEYVLTLASKSVMEFSADGGKGEIGYLLTEVTRAEDGSNNMPAEEETPVKATCDANWITDLVVAESITFNVLPNDGDERETFVKVAYEDQKFQVLVRQLSNDVSDVDVEFRATHLNGTYFGKLQTYGYNYFIVLSDSGLTEMKDGYGIQYRFDLYSGESSALEPVDYVPEGVYVFGDCSPGTIDASQSYLLPGDGSSGIDYASAKVTVTKDKIVAEVRLMNGKVHRVIYEGSLALDYLNPTAQDVAHSTQTADVNFDVTGGAIMAYYRGDYFGKDADVWFLHMIENKADFAGVYLMMDLMVDKSEGGYNNIDALVGEYTVADHTMTDYANTFAPGYMRDDWCQMHTWYMNCINGGIDSGNWAPFVAGKITIAKEDDGFAITMDGRDDVGNKVNGTFRGKVIDLQDQSYDL